MFEYFIITDHIVERYCQRAKASQKEVISRIKKDLHFTKVKQIINLGNVRHVFTLHSKEFIFEKKGSVWILKTIIKRNRQENQVAIDKRKQLAAAM